MERLRKTVILILAAGIPAAASPFMKAASPDICFAAGAVTYRLSSSADPADYRVAIDNRAAHPDLRVRLVDRVDAADFALTDDTGAMIGSACRAQSDVRSVHIVDPATPADIIVAISRSQDTADVPRTDNRNLDFSLYVHSVRVSHREAAALFALVRRAPDADRGVAVGHLADTR